MVADLKPVLDRLGFEHTGIPSQSVMDRLAAAYAWKDAQSRDQAIMVAAKQNIDWEALRDWFANEGESDEELRRFMDAVEARKDK